MKIIYILPINMSKWGYSLDDYIDTHFSVEIAKEVSRKGHQVELHTFWNDSFTKEVEGVKIFFYKPSINYLFRHNKSQISFRLLFKKFPDDAIIHFHEPNLMFYIPFALFRNDKLVVQHHGNGIVNPFPIFSANYMIYGLIRRTILKYLLSKAKLCLVLSKSAGANFKEYGVENNKIIISPNGIQISNFKEYDKILAKKDLNLKENKKILLFVGRINKEKGILELIEAVNLISKSQNVEFVALGSMQDESLRHIVAPYWRGFKKSEELQKWYCAADVFCLPSYDEPFGIVLIEAMYYNLPIVTSYAGGPKEFFKKSQVIFIKPKSVRSLTDGIITAINKPEHLKYKSGRDIVINTYSWEKICKKFIQYYFDISLKHTKYSF